MTSINHKSRTLFVAGILLAMIIVILPAGATHLTLYPSGTNDEFIARVVANESYTVITNGIGTQAYNGTNSPDAYVVIVASTSGGYTTNTKIPVIVNTSSVPDTATLTAGALVVYIADGNNGLGDIGMALTNFTPYVNGATTFADYNRTGTIPYAPNVTWAQLVGSGAGWYAFNLTSAGLALVNKTGNTNLMLTSVWDIANTDPTYSSGGSSYLHTFLSESPTNRPYLDLDYTTASTAVDWAAYGDSITLGNDATNNWVTQMKLRHNTSAVVDRFTGGAGWYSTGGLWWIEDYYNTSMVHFFPMFGVADSYYGITGTQTGQNIDGICDAVEANGSICHPLVHTQSSTYPDPGGRTANITLERNYLIAQGRTPIDVWDAIDMTPNNGIIDAVNESLLSDGTHPTNEAYGLIAEYIWTHSSLAADTAPVANFIMNSTYGVPRKAVQFTSTSTGSPATYLWQSYNDSSTAPGWTTFATNDASPVHTFGNGNFTIKLNVSNAYGSSTKTATLNVSAGAGQALSPSFKFFPADHIWNVPIDDMPVDIKSNTYVNSSYPDGQMWFATIWPINRFTTSTAKQDFIYLRYPEFGDQVPFPVTDNATVEEIDDAHMLAVNPDTNELYESFWTYQAPNGTWSAEGEVKWDLSSYALRTDGMVSTDAAGLAVTPGIIRYEEVAAGNVTHAGRLGLYTSQNTHVWPARADGVQANTSYPPLGQRFRLKASFDASGYSAKMQTIITGLKTYGVMLADQTAEPYWTISMDNDPRWNYPDDPIWSELATITGSDFEAVNVASLMVDEDSGRTVAEESPSQITAHFYMNITAEGGVTVSATPTPTPTPTPTTTSGGYGAPEILDSYYVGGAYQMTVDGKTFGGGTPEHIYTNATPGAYVVDTKSELLSALTSAASNPGSVIYVEEWANIDMGSSSSISIPASTTLASNRGQGSSKGGRIYTKTLGGGSTSTNILFRTSGSNVHITGLILEGEMYPENMDGYYYIHYLDGSLTGWPIYSPESQYRTGVWVYNTGFEVDNCVLQGFAYSDIYVDGVPTSGRPWIHHNFINGSQNCKEGYGVNVGAYTSVLAGHQTESDALIEGNVFNRNRHDITGDGDDYEHYTVRYNRFLNPPVFTVQGFAHVDAHGDDGYSGQRYDIYSNTFESGTQPAIHQRGVSSIGMYIHDNEITEDASRVIYHGSWLATGISTPIYQTYGTTNMVITNNRWNGNVYSLSSGILHFE